MNHVSNTTSEIEEWRDVKGYEGLYQVSNLGRVKSLPKYSNSKGYPELRKEKILKPYSTGKYRNYLTVRFLDKKSYKVHRLVAEAFISNPDNLPMVNHKDENPSNNRVENLEWCTNAYNVKYSVKPLTEEHKSKISQSKRGVSTGPRSEEFREKMRQIHLGMHHSEETKEKMRQHKKGRSWKIDKNGRRYWI